MGVMRNSGQSCNAPTRMLVAAQVYDEAVAVAAEVAAGVRVGDPRDPDTVMGPVAGRRQFETVTGYIEQGIAEGARLVAGGPGRPDGFARGFYVKPTVFADVQPGDAHLPGGDLRPGALHDPVRRRGRGRGPGQRLRLRALRLRQLHRPGARPPRGPAAAHRHGAPQRRPAGLAARRSAATSSPATGASGGVSASRSSSRSRPSWAGTGGRSRAEPAARETGENGRGRRAGRLAAPVRLSVSTCATCSCRGSPAPRSR